MPLVAHPPGTLRLEAPRGCRCPRLVETTTLWPWCPASEHSGHLMAPNGWAPQDRVLTKYLPD